MSFTGGKSLKLSIFGSSHGEAIGGSLDGFPVGFKLDVERMKKWVGRRRPGANLFFQ